MSTKSNDKGFSDEVIARSVHNLNASIKADHEQEIEFWHELHPDAWQRADTFRQINLLRDNPDMTAQEEHVRWLSARLEDGWQYGAVRNPDKKESPLLVPWEKLPFVNRALSESGFSVIRILLGQDQKAVD